MQNLKDWQIKFNNFEITGKKFTKDIKFIKHIRDKFIDGSNCPASVYEDMEKIGTKLLDKFEGNLKEIVVDFETLDIYYQIGNFQINLRFSGNESKYYMNIRQIKPIRNLGCEFRMINLINKNLVSVNEIYKTFEG